MKIKQVLSLCKNRSHYSLRKDNYGTQWLGDGAAFYLLNNCPIFDKESLFAISDLTEKQIAKMFFEENAIKPDYFIDTFENEVIAEKMQTQIITNGNVYIPYITSHGIKFIDAKYLKPVIDSDDIEVYERNYDNATILAVKQGMLLIAIMAAIDIKSAGFANDTKMIAEQAINNLNETDCEDNG